MEIIKRGKKPADRDYQGTCSYCGTVVRFKQAEGEYISDQRDGDCVKVTCPECKNPIFGGLIRGTPPVSPADFYDR